MKPDVEKYAVEGYFHNLWEKIASFVNDQGYRANNHEVSAAIDALTIACIESRKD